MIDLYTWITPNGRKISILLEELGLPYDDPSDRHRQERAVRAGFPGDQPQQQDSRRSSTAIPASSLMELGAIMIYLADKTGKFLPQQGEPRYRVIEWLMWQMGGIGPMLGQAHHFLHFNKGKAPYAEERYRRGGAAALRRPRSPAGGSRFCRRRLLDRRHGDLAVDLALRVARDRP